MKAKDNARRGRAGVGNGYDDAGICASQSHYTSGGYPLSSLLAQAGTADADRSGGWAMSSLSEEHRKSLVEGSGISLEVIEARGYRTVTTAQELQPLGFTKSQWNVPGLLLPVWTPDGGNGDLYAYRPDNPHLDRRGRPVKYLFPRGAKMRLDCPPSCRDRLGNPSIHLWITEGQKKADALASRGLCAVALLGVWNFKGKNAFGSTTILADFDYIAFNGRDVRIVFDSDVMLKSEVRAALDRLTEHLQRNKAHVTAVYLPSEDGAKVGVDDYLLTHTVEDLEGLVEAPRPLPRAAAPVVELLEEAPKVIRCPLSLIDGVAYAAIWPWVQVTVTETVNKKGEVVKHNPPMVTTEQHLVIIRGDGARFSEMHAAGMPSFADLGLGVRLPEIPRQDRLWSTRGMLRYLEGHRPDPMDVFNRVADVVDRFIDFARSLADQRTMAELVACHILGTYFLPAFQVVGYLWPNGERGSGKTHLLVTVCELAYLGTVILAGSTYPTLRDLADYGATLAFDDADAMDKKADPDKRTLLLAGNRRGAMIAAKEQVGKGEWRTRQVDTFCPRLFSAIRLPDPVLASRTIVIPLLRTLDRDKANADPLDYTLWPHDRQTLVDDLWVLALAHLPELPEVDREVANRATLTGRSLDTWRALLAVALWLEEDLFIKMDRLSVQYQQEKRELETTDLPALCVQAMMELAEERGLFCDNSDMSYMSDDNVASGLLFFSVSELSEVITRLAKEMDRHSGDEPFATVQRIGYTLTRLRVPNKRKPGGDRYREISCDDLQRLAISYGILSSLSSLTSLSSQNGDNPGEPEAPPASGPVVVRLEDLDEYMAQHPGAEVVPF